MRRPPSTWVTLARLTPTRLASSARVATSPASNIRCHSLVRSLRFSRARPVGRFGVGRPKSTKNAVNRFLFEELLGSPKTACFSVERLLSQLGAPRGVLCR